MNGLDTDVPRWFQDASSWYSSEARVQNNSMFNLKLQSEVLNLQEKKQSIENTALTNQRLSKDLTDIPTWMRDHPTWQSRSDAPWPTALTPQGDRMLQEQRLRDSQSIQAETAVMATHDFATRVAKLREVSPEAARYFSDYITQKPTPAILSALGEAEAQMQIYKEKSAEAARLRAEAAAVQAQSEGAEVKETFGPQGVTRTITHEAPGVQKEGFERTLSDGSKVFINPKSGAFKFLNPQGKEDKPNFAQLRMLAKDIETSSPDDYKTIMGILLNRATNSTGASVKQTGPSSSPAAPSSSQPQPKQSDIDYLKAHPDKKAGFDSRFGAGAADKYLK